MTTIGSLFAGIGGLELGLERATGARTVWQVEADPWCRAVLAHHWPDAVRFDDVRTASALPAVDIMCGGFPCQDISAAGKGAGLDGARSGLWREFARLVGEGRPKVVVVENVAALATRGLSRVLSDLADLGYVGSWNVVTAASVGAPHLRTPTASLADKGGRLTPRKSREGGTLIESLSARGAAGSLHPQFVEWMMGFDRAWTDLDGDDAPPPTDDD